MKVGMWVTTHELCAINKAYFAKSSCRCGNCSQHLTFEELGELETLGPYTFATLQRLRKKGVEVEFKLASPRPETRHLLKPGTRGRQLVVDRFFTIES